MRKFAMFLLIVGVAIVIAAIYGVGHDQVGATVAVGCNTGSGVSRRYKAPFRFTGGTIAQVTVDISGKPYEDLERELALAFSRD